MDALRFNDKVVLVVGGSSGIGNGIARAFYLHGAKVHVWGTRPTAANYAGVEGSDLSGLQYANVDVSGPDEVDRYVPPFRCLDILILAQGTVVYKRGEFEREGWDRVMSVNLHSLRTCAMKFYDMLATARGKLIILSSVAGFSAARGNPAYSASKHGAVGLTSSLGEAWAPDGISVNGIAPGIVDTKLTKVTVDNPKRRDATLESIPLGRLGRPSDMAGAALFLASPLADYMIGQTLIVDGGLSLS